MHAYKIRQHREFVVRDRSASTAESRDIVQLAAEAGQYAEISSPARELQQALHKHVVDQPFPPGLSMRSRMAVIAGLATGMWATLGVIAWTISAVAT